MVPGADGSVVTGAVVIGAVVGPTVAGVAPIGAIVGPAGVVEAEVGILACTDLPVNVAVLRSGGRPVAGGLGGLITSPARHPLHAFGRTQLKITR